MAQHVEATQMSLDGWANETYPHGEMYSTVNKLNADTPPHG